MEQEHHKIFQAHFGYECSKNKHYFTDEDALKEIWREILKWSYDLLYENAIAQGTEDDIDWSKIMKKIRKKKDGS